MTAYDQNYKNADTPNILSRYLYGVREDGSDGLPVKLFDNELIRNEAPPHYEIDVVDFMTTGAGRFAKASENPIVQIFFAMDVNDPLYQPLGPGTYSKTDVIVAMGLSLNWNLALNFYASEYADARDDYAERIFIFQTQSFQINDGAVFRVDADGTRYIENFSIIPDARPEVPENFDFQGGSPLGEFLRTYVEPKVDPSGIGHKVFIDFTGQLPTTALYDLSDFNTDKSNVSLWKSTAFNIGPLGFTSKGSALLDQFYADGITNPITQQQVIFGTEYDGGPRAGPEGRVLHVYTTNNDDYYTNTTPTDFFDFKMFDTSDFDIVAMLLGDGDDTITGVSPLPVIVAGGKGDDHFDFTRMAEMSGNDLVSIVYEKGDGNDTIEDSYEAVEFSQTNYRYFVSKSGIDAIYLKDIDEGDITIRWDAELHSSIQVLTPGKPELDGRKEFYVGRAEIVFKDTGDVLDIGYLSGETWKNEAGPISHDQNGVPIYYNPDSTDYKISFLNKIYLTDEELNVKSSLYGSFVPLGGGMGFDNIEYIIA